MVRGWWTFLSLGALAFAVSCTDKTTFTQSGTTDVFVQDFNPPFLDILWVVNDRTPMYEAREHLIAEASRFFERLDGATASYRMAFTSADSKIYPGELKPHGSPVILEKNFGTVAERSAYFGAILAQVINLKTSATDEGLENTLRVLQTKFVPRQNVPLVLVFISDSDDHSDELPPGDEAVEYYTKQYLALKANNPKLLRVYAINYTPLPQGAQKDKHNRCATRYGADIDKDTFQDRYFRLARGLSFDLPDPNLATADLCKPFASNIDLSGLRQKELPRRFTLSQTPRSGSLLVTVVRKSTGEDFSNLKWEYLSETNEIVFEAPPPEGTNIVVTYHPD